MKLPILGIIAFCVVGSCGERLPEKSGIFTSYKAGVTPGSISPDGLDGIFVSSPVQPAWKPVSGWKKIRAHQYCPWCNTPRGSYSASRGNLERHPGDRLYHKIGPTFACPSNMRYMLGRHYEIRRVDKKSKSVVALCNDKSGVRNILDFWQTTIRDLGFPPDWARPCNCARVPWGDFWVEYREVKK